MRCSYAVPHAAGRQPAGSPGPSGQLPAPYGSPVGGLHLLLCMCLNPMQGLASCSCSWRWHALHRSHRCRRSCAAWVPPKAGSQQQACAHAPGRRGRRGCGRGLLLVLDGLNCEQAQVSATCTALTQHVQGPVSRSALVQAMGSAAEPASVECCSGSQSGSALMSRRSEPSSLRPFLSSSLARMASISAFLLGGGGLRGAHGVSAAGPPAGCR